jgi:ArsR family metal-binding transcriptional regulator
MDDENLVTTTSPLQRDLDRAAAILDNLGIPYRRLDPTPPLRLVAVSALILSREAVMNFGELASDVLLSGWVPHKEPAAMMPAGAEAASASACFERAAIVVLRPCVADEARIRLTAQVQGDLSPVLPYLNAVMPAASYTPASGTLNYMDKHRMVALSEHSIAIAKADEIVDAWLTLERIRLLVEKTWRARNEIRPCYEARIKPAALEIVKRLPGTNCRLCGEATCFAFAMKLWSGTAALSQCAPIFAPEQEARRAALADICSMLGMPLAEP